MLLDLISVCAYGRKKISVKRKQQQQKEELVPVLAVYHYLFINFLTDRGGLLPHSIPPPCIQSLAKGRNLNWNSSLLIKQNDKSDKIRNH